MLHSSLGFHDGLNARFSVNDGGKELGWPACRPADWRPTHWVTFIRLLLVGLAGPAGPLFLAGHGRV
jgi:hypothetical protein